MRKLRSEITREGLARTPHRAFMRAMGLDDAAIQKPSDAEPPVRRVIGPAPIQEGADTVMGAPRRVAITSKAEEFDASECAAAAE